jgi:hypothetical protein
MMPVPEDATSIERDEDPSPGDSTPDEDPSADSKKNK